MRVWSACTSGVPDSSAPHLPPGDAGKVLARTLDAAGGWARWMTVRDVAYVNTLTLLDHMGGVTSQSIGWYMAPLHQGLHARMESIGLDSEVAFGADARDTWGLRDGEPISEPQRLEVARFNLVSNLFWFSLPFAAAEMASTVTDLGEMEGKDQMRWHRLKLVFEAKNPAIPGNWFVLYINPRTNLIDRVHTRMTASFLRQELWVGKWLDYHDWNGLKKERRRKFYPADDTGEIIGNLVADQLVEQVHLNNGYTPESFEKPAKAAEAKPARGMEGLRPEPRVCRQSASALG